MSAIQLCFIVDIIIQLTARTAQDIVQAITQFDSKRGPDMQRMVMLTSDGASVMLGKHTGFVKAPNATPN